MLPLESLKPPSGSPGRRCLHGQHVRVSDERALLRLTIHDDPGSGLFWSENRTSEPIIIYCAPYHIIISHTVVVLPAGAQLQLLLRALVSPPPPKQLLVAITASYPRSYYYRPVNLLFFLLLSLIIPATIRPAAVLGLQHPNRIDASPSLVSISTLSLSHPLSNNTLSLVSYFPSSFPWRAILHFLLALYEGPLRSFRLHLPFRVVFCMPLSTCSTTPTCYQLP